MKREIKGGRERERKLLNAIDIRTVTCANYLSVSGALLFCPGGCSVFVTVAVTVTECSLLGVKVISVSSRDKKDAPLPGDSYRESSVSVEALASVSPALVQGSFSYQNSSTVPPLMPKCRQGLLWTG